MLIDGVWRLWREARLLAALHRGVRRRRQSDSGWLV